MGRDLGLLGSRSGSLKGFRRGLGFRAFRV